MAEVRLVTEDDLTDVVPLMRGYLGFYGVEPANDEVVALCRALLADPHREGVQLLARDDSGTAVGFATVYWTWSTLSAARIAVMNDLFVAPEARGSGTAEQLIEACADLCRERGDIASLGWQTAKDNLRAQTVYDRVGGVREEWIDYSISLR